LLPHFTYTWAGEEKNAESSEDGETHMLRGGRPSSQNGPKVSISGFSLLTGLEGKFSIRAI